MVTEHPTKMDQMVVSMVPQKTILVVPDQNNCVFFESEGTGANGFYVLSRGMPAARELNVHVYIMHSRRTIKEIGKVLKDIQKGVGGQAVGLLTNILGTSSPWLAISKKALPMIGQILEKIPDRNMGFVSMFERFGPEFEDQVELDREIRGGNITMVYSWAVDQ